MTKLDTLIERLASALATLDETHSLILSRSGSNAFVSETGSNRFVQFARFGSDLRAESVGDRYLDGGDELTPEQVTMLAELGWSSPDEGGNYWGQWSDPPPFRDVATMALQTLERVHGVDHAEQLDFDGSPEILRGFEFAGDDDEIDSPGGEAASGWRPTARHMAFWDYDPEEPVVCHACGWSGRPGDQQAVFNDVLDVRCGSCDTMLLVVAFPTLEETREAAASGNPRAQAGLPDIEAQAGWRERAASSQLTDLGQLPDLSGDALVIVWDLEVVDGEQWQVLRHGETEVWREVAYYESYERFRDVFAILQGRYGDRLVEVRPTLASELWLYGDRLSAPAIIKDLNRSLRPHSS